MFALATVAGKRVQTRLVRLSEPSDPVRITSIWRRA